MHEPKLFDEEMAATFDSAATVIAVPPN